MTLDDQNETPGAAERIEALETKVAELEARGAEQRARGAELEALLREHLIRCPGTRDPQEPSGEP